MNSKLSQLPVLQEPRAHVFCRWFSSASTLVVGMPHR